jgi:hypothetical protein
MKKTLIGVSAAWLVFLLLTATAVWVTKNQLLSCEKLDAITPVSELQLLTSHKHYALHFPVK